jgi:hypothetical protein
MKQTPEKKKNRSKLRKMKKQQKIELIKAIQHERATNPFTVSLIIPFSILY